MRGGIFRGWIRIERQAAIDDPDTPEVEGGGTQDELGGEWEPAPQDPLAPPSNITPEGALILYDGPCNWQEAGPEVRLGRYGERVQDAAAVVLLQPTRKAKLALERIRTGDTAVVTPERGRPRVVQQEVARLMGRRIVLKAA